MDDPDSPNLKTPNDDSMIGNSLNSESPRNLDSSAHLYKLQLIKRNTSPKRPATCFKSDKIALKDVVYEKRTRVESDTSQNESTSSTTEKSPTSRLKIPVGSPPSIPLASIKHALNIRRSPTSVDIKPNLIEAKKSRASAIFPDSVKIGSQQIKTPTYPKIDSAQEGITKNTKLSFQQNKIPAGGDSISSQPEIPPKPKLFWQNSLPDNVKISSPQSVISGKPESSPMQINNSVKSPTSLEISPQVKPFQFSPNVKNISFLRENEPKIPIFQNKTTSVDPCSPNVPIKISQNQSNSENKIPSTSEPLIKKKSLPEIEISPTKDNVHEKPILPDFFPKLRKIADPQKSHRRPQTQIFGELSSKTPNLPTERNFTKISGFSIVKESSKSSADQKYDNKTQETSQYASSQQKESKVPELVDVSLELGNQSPKKNLKSEKKVDVVSKAEEEKVIAPETTKENRVDDKKLLTRTSSLGESHQPLQEKHNASQYLVTSPRSRAKTLSSPASTTCSTLTKNPIFQNNKFLMSNVATIDINSINKQQTKQLSSDCKYKKIIPCSNLSELKKKFDPNSSIDSSKPPIRISSKNLQNQCVNKSPNR